MCAVRQIQIKLRSKVKLGHGRRVRPTIARLDHTKARASEMQQTAATLQHIGKSAAAVVKPAKHIDQWHGIFSRANEDSIVREE